MKRYFETVKQLSMSDSFDNPLVDFISNKHPSFTNDFMNFNNQIVLGKKQIGNKKYDNRKIY